MQSQLVCLLQREMCKCRACMMTSSDVSTPDRYSVAALIAPC